ncbi:hypothetical protein NP233_g13042 [Leucocoprinus birnbaumii]|uniref:Holliday junction resolvase Gen1 C-terminal domain-containing protein n=1 Tax=Leucocoprinus birnbaumii TaxID=56174 RepID=A0AAD5VDL3_9AGAR|nr:hypothetical protein NP233_g13042 [Leucocoprinus birnbaumii]
MSPSECRSSPCIIAKYFSNSDSASTEGPGGHHPSNLPLILDIPRERHHASTDGLAEYRLEIAPSQLVHIIASGVHGLRQPKGVHEWSSSGSEDDMDMGGEGSKGQGKSKRKRARHQESINPESHLLLWMPTCIVDPVEGQLVREFRENQAQKELKKSSKKKQVLSTSASQSNVREQTVAAAADSSMESNVMFIDLT